MESKSVNTLIIAIMAIAVILIVGVNFSSRQESNDAVSSGSQQLLGNAAKIDIVESGQTGVLKQKISLENWKPAEIAEAISQYNSRLDPKAYGYRYKEDCTFYAQYGEIFGQDPFCDFVLSMQGEEWNDGHLRIVHLDYDVKNPAADKYQDYVNNILKSTQLDSDLVCYAQDECNDIKVITCTKGSDNYFSWFEGNVLMTSINDGRRNLNAFTRFYCSSELQPLTGSLVSNLADKDLIINQIASFIKKLS